MYRRLCAWLLRSRLALWHSFTLIDLYSVYRRRTHPLSVPPFDLLNAGSTDTETSALKTRSLDLGAWILEPSKLAQKPSFDHIKNASNKETHPAHGFCKDLIWTTRSVRDEMYLFVHDARWEESASSNNWWSWFTRTLHGGVCLPESVK